MIGVRPFMRLRGCLTGVVDPIICIHYVDLAYAPIYILPDCIVLHILRPQFKVLSIYPLLP